MISKIKHKLSNLDEHTQEVVKKSAASMIVKVLGMLAGLGVSIFLGRVLGADGIGIINLTNQIIGLLLVLGMFGLQQIIIREVAIAKNNNDSNRVKNILFTSLVINGSIGVIITTALILFSEKISIVFFHNPELRFPLIIAAIAFVPQIISRIIGSSLIAYRKVWQSNLVDQTLSSIIIGLLLTSLWFLKYDIDVKTTAIIYGIGRITVTLTMYTYWTIINQKQSFAQVGRSQFIGSEIFKSGFNLLMVNAALLISTSADSIMLGWLSDTKEVGLYTVASRIALLSSFILQITISVIAPKIAVLYNQNKQQELEGLVQKITFVLSIIGLLFLLLFYFFGKFVLNLWGEEFTIAYPILIVLALGQFFNMASGPIGNMLIMAKKERVLRNITLITVILNILLNYFLITLMDAKGASIATTITTTLNMVLTYYYVRKITGLKFYKVL